jgi:2,3-bisphosphoglycerate-independent phosphoglycerate mutase
VPSPRVATYDQAPAMAAASLTDSCIAAIEKGMYSLIVINYANPDMVGHTGVMAAATEAIQEVDHCIGRLLDAVGRMGGTMLITADHGNAEVMQGPDGQAWTAHTTNPVPVILVEGERRKVPGLGNAIQLRDNGGLADIAPTLLQLLDLPKPDAMSGASLIEAIDAVASRSRLPQPV